MDGSRVVWYLTTAILEICHLRVQLIYFTQYGDTGSSETSETSYEAFMACDRANFTFTCYTPEREAGIAQSV